MRPRFLISLGLVVFGITVIVFLFRPVKPTATPEPLQAAVQPGKVLATVTSEPTPVAAASASPQPPVQEAVSATNQPTVEPREIKLRQMIEAANVPIDFYGQVVDQDTNPVPGVKINVAIQQLYSPSLTNLAVGGTVLRLEKETGSDGRFDIHGEKGASVEVESVHKGGCELEPTQRTFGTTGGSYENPVIFKMWPTNIHEQLITGGKSFNLEPDGRPYFINFTDDTISESIGGDLKVWIQYTNQPVRGQPYDWSAGIEVITGGLLEEELGSAMYEAPTDGYVPSFQLSGQIKGGQRGDIGERQFYLKMKHGQEYGQMSIDLYAPFNDKIPGLIRCSYAINPSGSRILR